MLQLLRLLLPALIPSWRFFKEVAASPRIDIRHGAGPWTAAATAPAALSGWQTLTRLVWNPVWTEHLFLASCAERLLEEASPAALSKLQTRLARLAPPPVGETLQFRLRLIDRVGDDLTDQVAFESAAWVPRPAAGPLSDEL